MNDIPSGAQIKRPNGSIVAVLESMYVDHQPFLRLRIVEDSDWLSVNDMRTIVSAMHRLVPYPE